MTKLLNSISAWWASMTTAARIYIIGIPACVTILQVPWLTSWMPTDLKTTVTTTAYWLLALAATTFAGWLHQHLQTKQVQVDDNTARIAAIDDPLGPKPTISQHQPQKP